MGRKMQKSKIDGSKLRRLREELALTIEQLAEQTQKRARITGDKSITAKTIWRIEHGSGAQPYTLYRLADALGVDTKDLLVSEESSETPFTENLCNFGEYIEDRTNGFVGRGFVFEAIDKFVNKNECGYFFIHGDPGIGKTSVLAQLVKDRDWIHHFNVRALGINTTETFVKNICSQLIIDYELGYSILPAEISIDGRIFTEILQEVSGKLGPNEKMVIVVDALDEVESTSYRTGLNLLFLPSLLPRGIFVIASTRREAFAMRIECCCEDFNLDSDSKKNMSDIIAYLKQKLLNKEIQSYIKRCKLSRNTFVETMKDKSQGNFMYLHYVLPEIENGAYNDLDLGKIPVGLENYYEDHWRRMGMMIKQPPREKIKIIYVLSEVLQPVSRQLLADFCKEDEITVQGVLDEWNQFLHRQEVEGVSRFSIYHNSFRDFLNRKEIVRAAGVSIQDINHMIGDSLYYDLYGKE